jgi:predicted alpha/beta-hydrolase family hydrolase
MFAHIAGIPVEETALSFAPVAVAAGGVAGARLRRISRRRRPRARGGAKPRPRRLK